LSESTGMRHTNHYFTNSMWKGYLCSPCQLLNMSVRPRPRLALFSSLEIWKGF